jgi:hypothetical protein
MQSGGKRRFPARTLKLHVLAGINILRKIVYEETNGNASP